MELISNNQRMLVEQQSAQVIIGEKLEKVCGDVQQLQKEVNDLQSHSVSSSVDNKRKVKVPSQISVSLTLYSYLLYDPVQKSNDFDTVDDQETLW